MSSPDQAEISAEIAGRGRTATNATGRYPSTTVRPGGRGTVFLTLAGTDPRVTVAG